MTPQIVFDGAHLRMLHLDHGHKRLMVTFDFRSPGKSDFGPVNASKGFVANGYDQLMIKTRANDWFINGDTSALEGLLGPLSARYDRVHTLGYSMGGYAALRFARSLRADFVVAVSPQVSIDPGVVPFDRRYRAEAAGFDPKLGQIDPVSGLAGTIVYDPFIRPDRRHAQMAQALMPGLALVRTPFGGHPATSTLRDAGRSGVIQRAALELVAPAQIAMAHRSSRHKSPGYWYRLARRAAGHHPALAAQARARVGTLGENGPGGV